MRFRFCGEGDCPDWILAEINTLSRLSSIKLKLLGQVVAKSLLNPPIDFDKAEKLFSESKLDSDVDLKACIACLSFIISSTVRYRCDHAALFSELQQLGLPREHSMSIKKVVDDCTSDLEQKFKAASLKVNRLEDASVVPDLDTQTASLNLKINGENQSVIVSPLTVDVLIENLKQAKTIMTELTNSPYNFCLRNA